jgi:hypothetical protein
VSGLESERADFDTLSGNVALFEFTSTVTLDESGLTDTTITDEEELNLEDGVLGGLKLMLKKILRLKGERKSNKEMDRDREER